MLHVDSDSAWKLQYVHLIELFILTPAFIYNNGNLCCSIAAGLSEQLLVNVACWHGNYNMFILFYFFLTRAFIHNTGNLCCSIAAGLSEQLFPLAVMW